MVCNPVTNSFWMYYLGACVAMFFFSLSCNLPNEGDYVSVGGAARIKCVDARDAAKCSQCT